MATSDNATEETLLTRLANLWHNARSGNPGFHWHNARTAHMTSAVYGQLHHCASWAPGATDRELMGIWLGITGDNNWPASAFDSWDEGTAVVGRTQVQMAANRKKAASASRRSTSKTNPVSAAVPQRPSSSANATAPTHYGQHQAMQPQQRYHGRLAVQPRTCLQQPRLRVSLPQPQQRKQ